MAKKRVAPEVEVARREREVEEGAGAEYWDLAEMFDVALRASRRSERTHASYREALVLLRDYLQAQGMPRAPEQIKREHLEAFFADLAERRARRSGQPMTGTTIMNRYRSLHAYFSWLVSIDELRASPMDRMQAPKVARRPPPVLTEEQIGRLVGQLRAAKDFEGRRDYALVLMLLECGLRREEMASLRIEDIDWETHSLVVRKGKGGKLRWVGFGDVAELALRAYMRARRQHEHAEAGELWLGRQGPLTADGIFRIVKRRAAQAGLGRVWVHLFRHSWAHYFREAGASDEELQAAGGWESGEMVRWYGASRAAERARRAGREHSVGDKLFRRERGKEKK